MTQPDQSGQPPHAADEGQLPDDGAGRLDLLHDRRALGLIGVAAVVVVALGYFVVLPHVTGGSGSSDTGVVASAHHVHHRAATTASASPSAAPAAVASAAPVLAVRDPFSPLYVPPTAAASTAGTAPSVSASPTPAAAASQPQTVVIEPPKPAVTTTVHSATAKYTLTFVKVINTTPGRDTIEVTLNGVAETLNVGQVFPSATAGPFQFTGLITSLNGAAETKGPAEFLYGDTSFAMELGETQLEN